MKYFDLHCDTIGECHLQKQPLYRNHLHLDLSRGAEFSAWTQCFAIWIPDEMRGQQALDYFKAVHQTYVRECAQNKTLVTPCIENSDFARAERLGTCGTVLTVEGGAVLGGNLDNIPYLASCGVRMLTLTWNGTCEFGDGAMVTHPKGLTKFGRKAIPKLEQQRIVVDISHASEPLFYDAAEIASKPLVASHSNARAVCNHPRNLTNEQVQIIKQSGGLIGLNFHPPFLKEDGIATVDDLIAHAEHFLSLGAQDSLAVGSDFDGADLPQGIRGIEGIYAVFERFLQLGYSETLLNKIFYTNAQKFFVSL